MNIPPEIEEAHKVNQAIDQFCAAHQVARDQADVHFQLSEDGQPQYLVSINLKTPITKVTAVITVADPIIDGDSARI